MTTRLDGFSVKRTPREGVRAGSSEQGEPIERTLDAYTALNRRDFDAVMHLFGAASVWDVSRWGLGAHVGPEQIRRFLDDWFGSLVEYEVRPEELVDLGGGVVSVVVLQVARRAGSRGELRLRSVAVFVWEGELLERVTVHPEIEEGLADAERAAAERA
jgi:hypothetical protein